ncbi:NUMOD4 motif-containing HNH endonuclease [Enterococcus italicus]|nr:NUMOD4 motif-containing HNH endonuclease [Enterococcus italicus]
MKGFDFMEDNSMNKEIWKDISGYEGLYQVSNFGRVKSLARKVPRSGGKLHSVKETMKTPSKRKGYLLVNLSKLGIKKRVSIHRLVALAFIDNPSDKPEVNHIDENKENNYVHNLEWVTAKENSNHGTRNERIADYIRRRNKSEHGCSYGPPTKKVNKVDPITGKVICEYDSVKSALKALGVSPKSGTLSSCLTGKRGHKTYKGYRWEYADKKAL